MKTHTSSFKEQIKLMGKEIDSKITFGSTVLGKNDLNAVTPSYQGAILKSVMKQLDIDSNVAIPIGTILNYEFGLKVNGEYEYINYGNYVVYSIEKQEDTNSYKITCYDKLLYSMLDYVKLPITYPISIRDYINTISTVLGLTFANRSGTFANYNKQIQADLYDGLGYTFRDVLDELAQVTASTICLNNNDELEIRYITETNDTIDEEFLKDVNVNFGEKFGAVNTIVLSRSADSDSVYYPSVLPADPYEIKISDNQIMNGNDRADFLPDIYEKLNGLEFYTNDFVSTGIVYYDLCDRYSVKVGDNTYSCVMFNDEVLVTQGLEENVYTELPEQTETDYKHASKDDRMINQVYIIAKKNEAEILAVVNTTNQIQKEINPTDTESGSIIKLEDASNNPLIDLEIEGKSEQETRSGKNLLNLEELNNSKETWSIPAKKLTLTLKPNTQYTCSSNVPAPIEDDITQKPLYFNSERWSADGGVCLNQPRTTTTDENGKLYVAIGTERTYSEELLNGTYYIQIEEGNMATPFEKYGAIPSPDYPSEIESVGYENLFDGEIELGSISPTNGSLVDSATRTRSKNFIKVKPNTVYTFSKKVGQIRWIIGYDSNKNGISDGNYDGYSSAIKNGDSSVEVFNFVTTATTQYIKWYDTNSIDLTEKIQITKGDKEYPYIPFGKYGIEVETVGKNLFNINNINNIDDLNYKLTVSDNTITISNNSNVAGYTNSRKTLSALSPNLKVGDVVYLHFKNTSNLANKNMIYIGQTWNNGTSKTITQSMLDSNVIFYGGYNETAIISEFMITKQADNTYEPYKSNTTLIQLNEPLRNLPNGVKDLLYIKNNRLYVERKVGRVVLDGSENYTDWGTSQDWIGAYIINPVQYKAINGNDKRGLSDYFSVDSETNRDKDSIRFRQIDNQKIWYFVLNHNFTNLEEFENWLALHNTEVIYELAEPYTEELGEIETPSTYKGTTYIQTTDSLEPNLNITYVRDTVISDYVENHVTELKITESEIKSSVERVSTSVNGLNSTVNRVEEITTDNSQIINIISKNIITEGDNAGDVTEVTTTTGFTFNKDGMTIDDGSGFKAEHRANGTYYKDGTSVVGQYTKDGSKQKDLELFGIYSYGKNDINDTPMFIGQLYTDENSEECFGHFYNGGDY